MGTCPNIEVDLQVIDKSPFFFRTFHVKEKDKPMNDKEMQRVGTFRYFEEGHVSIFFSHYADCKKEFQFEKNHY